MTTRIYGFTALTGGGTGSLDKYPEAGMPALATDDYAIGHVSGVFYLYRFDGASAEAENPPAVIAPNSGSGRWILKSFSSNHNDLMNIDGGNASPEEYYHLASALYNVINSATAQSIIANPTGGATSVTNVTVAEQTLVGRITGGNVDALSVAQVKTLIGDVSDTAYAASWNGVTDVAPSKNAVYDEVELINYEGIRKNYIINGNFDLWNYGTSQTTSGSFSADRWLSSHVAITSKTASQQAFALGQTDVPGEPVWFMRQEVTTASAANEYCILTQRVYGVNTLAGKTVTLSFYAKADAVKNISIEFYQNFGIGGSAPVTAIGVDKFGLTTNWARYTVTADITSISGKTVGSLNYLEVVFWFTCGSDRAARTDSLGNQSGTFDIANVALVEGADIAPLVKSVSEEQSLCSVDDTAYGTSWNGVTDVAPSKNAVYDKIETLSAGFSGEVRMYAGSSAPSGWLLCDGTSYLRADYSALFAVIGTTYGSADGTHFNVPDFRGRIPIGVGTGTGGGAAGTGLPTGGSALTAVALGTWKGEETHVLTSAENATHSHKVDPPSTTSDGESSHTHTYSGDTGDESAHTHTLIGVFANYGLAGGGSTVWTNLSGSRTSSAGSAHKHSFSGTTSAGASHTHTVNIAEFDSGNSGSGTAHNTIQPVMGINFIIKT